MSGAKGRGTGGEGRESQGAHAAPVSAEPIRLATPLGEEVARSLRAGTRVLVSGVAYTARDAAHKRMVELLAAGRPLPFDLAGAIIYYAGPTPARPGRPIGSVGPTTSSRMDRYVEPLLAAGLRAMIGKGQRDPGVLRALERHGAVYLVATGGAGAFLARHIVSSEVVAWPELGAEAVRRIEMADFPAIVACDSAGSDIYESGQRAWRRE